MPPERLILFLYSPELIQIVYVGFHETYAYRFIPLKHIDFHDLFLYLIAVPYNRDRFFFKYKKIF